MEIIGRLNSQKLAINGIITLHAGDTFSTPIFIGSSIEPSPESRYELAADDKLYIGIMEPHQPFKYALIRKMILGSEVEAGKDPVFKLTSNDTEFVVPGVYYYEIKLQTTDEAGEEVVNTIVPRTKLVILA